MNTTFLNGDQEHKQRGLDYLKSTKETIESFMALKNPWDDRTEDGDSMIEYGLSFDYCGIDPEKEDDKEYYRYQMSWGGPSDEIRIFEDGTLEYVFLDWFVGVGFDVSDEDWAKWLKDWFEPSINWYEARENWNNLKTV